MKHGFPAGSTASSLGSTPSVSFVPALPLRLYAALPAWLLPAWLPPPPGNLPGMLRVDALQRQSIGCLHAALVLFLLIFLCSCVLSPKRIEKENEDPLLSIKASTTAGPNLCSFSLFRFRFLCFNLILFRRIFVLPKCFSHHMSMVREKTSRILGANKGTHQKLLFLSNRSIYCPTQPCLGVSQHLGSCCTCACRCCFGGSLAQCEFSAFWQGGMKCFY